MKEKNGKKKENILLIQKPYKYKFVQKHQKCNESIVKYVVLTYLNHRIIV